MILAIDPGNIESGVVIVDEKTLQPYFAEKMNNDELIQCIYDKCEPFTLPLGKFGNVSIPCLSSLWSSSGFSNIINIIKAIINGLICYRVAINLLTLFNNLRDPDNDKLEVMDL